MWYDGVDWFRNAMAKGKVKPEQTPRYVAAITQSDEIARNPPPFLPDIPPCSLDEGILVSFPSLSLSFSFPFSISFCSNYSSCDLNNLSSLYPLTLVPTGIIVEDF